MFCIKTLSFAGVAIEYIVLHQAFPRLPRQVQTGEVGVFLFKFLDDAQAVAIVLEATVVFHQATQNRLSFVAKRRMAEIMREGDGFGEVFVQPERAGDAARDARDFHGVRQARAQVVAGAVEKNLRLVFEPAEGA